MRHEARQLGIERLEKPVSRPLVDPPIIHSQIDAPPPGYHRMMLSEIIRIRGDTPPPDFIDAVTYVTHIPRNRDEVIDLLRNMTITIPPGQ
jgi:hypothetical protein